MKQLFFLGVCTLFLACGAPTNERGIASTTADSTASGSAYKSYDGFAPAAATEPVTAAATPAASPVVTRDSTVSVVPGTTTTPATNKPVPPPAKVPVAAATQSAADDSGDIKKGAALISKSDCLACHKVDVKVLGPSYKDVAAKYPNNAATVNQLVDKIKKGGSGVWGAIPMSPHPALSDDDAKAMVRYILSLK